MHFQKRTTNEHFLEIQSFQRIQAEAGALFDKKFRKAFPLHKKNLQISTKCDNMNKKTKCDKIFSLYYFDMKLEGLKNVGSFSHPMGNH